MGDAAVVVPPKDVATLTDALATLLTGHGARRRLAARTRTHALRHFDAADTVAAVAEVPRRASVRFDRPPVNRVPRHSPPGNATEPAVSVVMPTYRQAAFLPRAVGSLLAQTVRDWELLIVDDESPDGTREAAGRFLASPVR